MDVGGGIRHWAKRRKRENVEEAGGIKTAMAWRRKAVTNYYRLRGGKGIGGWWNDKVGMVDGRKSRLRISLCSVVGRLGE